jgi:hypothetical protein
MAQMVLLKNIGHEVTGPVNGPNEGWPQYEVPRLWLQQLQIRTETNAEPVPSPTISQPYPRPRPITKKAAPKATTPLIDPALVNQIHIAPTSPTEHYRHHEDNFTHDLNAESGIQSGPGPDAAADLDAPTVLGASTTTVRSSPEKAQEQNTRRRKVITPDDLAMKEAQELLKGGITKRTRKKK